jgi:hypothetical protein
MPPKLQIKTLWKNWDIVERKIKEEVNWLRKNIETFLQEERSAPMGCRECFLRKIAILIVSGQVKASNITKNPPLESFWLNVKTKKKKEICHGSDWHKETMQRIENHFLHLGYRVIREPDLNHGRADLGIYKKGKQDLLIEVGTTSFFKLWHNLETMRNCTYLIVPNDDKLIEFTRL